MAKKQWKKGWKIILINKDRSRWSCCSDGQEVKYYKNRTTKRPDKCGPLAVFERRRDAHEFLIATLSWAGLNRRIVKCLYIESEDISLWTSMYIMPEYRLPVGTKLADKVKCLE